MPCSIVGSAVLECRVLRVHRIQNRLDAGLPRKCTHKANQRQARRSACPSIPESRQFPCSSEGSVRRLTTRLRILLPQPLLATPPPSSPSPALIFSTSARVSLCRREHCVSVPRPVPDETKSSSSQARDGRSGPQVPHLTLVHRFDGIPPAPSERPANQVTTAHKRHARRKSRATPSTRAGTPPFLIADHHLVLRQPLQRTHRLRSTTAPTHNTQQHHTDAAAPCSPSTLSLLHTTRSAKPPTLPGASPTSNSSRPRHRLQL